MSQAIDHGTLSTLVEAGAVRGAHVIGQDGGWSVMVKLGMIERPLITKHSGQVRTFRQWDTLVRYLKNVGIAHFDVDTVNYDPDAVSTQRRPDRAEAMKRAHEAAAYDQWFKESVQASLDDPRPSIPDEEVRAEFDARKAELRRKLLG